MRVAEAGIAELKKYVDTLIVIPNQNLFRIANERTTFAEAFVLADQVLYSGVACIVDLIVKEGLINLDFADVQTIMRGMGTAMMGTGEATGEERARIAAEEAIANPLLDDVSLSGAKGVLLSIIGGRDMTLLRGRRGGDPRPPGGRRRGQHHRRRDVRRGHGDQTIRVAIVASGMVPKGAAQASHAQPVPVSPSHSMRPAEMPPHPPIEAGNGRIFNPEDLNPRMAHRDDPRAATSAAPRELWRAPGGVVIEESAPASQGSASNAPSAGAADRGHSGAPPPLRHDGGGEQRGDYRRVPSVDEFPPVAQREYAAKSSIYSGSPSRLQPLPPPAPSDEPERRGGLLQRLVGGRKGGRG